MTRERFDELIQRDLDGETTPAEREELQRGVAADPGVRARYEMMHEMVERLDKLSPIEPPAGMRGRIVEAYSRREAETPRHAMPAAALPQRRRRVFHLAYAAAAGLLIGLASAPLIFSDRSAIDPAEATGAMVSHPGEQRRVVDRLAGAGSNGRAELEIVRSHSSLTLQAHVRPQRPGRVTIGWDSGLALSGFSREQAGEPPLFGNGEATFITGGAESIILSFRIDPMAAPAGGWSISIDDELLIRAPAPEAGQR
jgi:anti-sigma factor RsiW